ncbi:MAG TPA: EAL domain-containing protein [Thermoanaerobaculia bacterium]|nr:EAL domain-containing protein [Thermoanaerobaculia bacterium]
MTVSKHKELYRLRGRWQKERARLYDRDSGLPTIGALTEDLGRRLQAFGSLAVFVFRPGSDGHVEQVWGWEAYDDLLLDFARRLKALQTDGVLPPGTFCVEHVRSDELLLFVEPGSGFVERPGAVESKAGELDAMIRGYLAERADMGGRFRSFVGAARIPYDAKYRVERLLYRGIQEARDQVTRQTVRAEIQGGALLQDAIARRDFYPIFQPVFDLSSGSMIGIEALSRGPRGSEIESGETLFSLADRTGMLVPLERICRAHSLEAASTGKFTGKIFLNLSPAAVTDSDFLGPSFLDQIAARGLSPDNIVLEITERTYVVYEELFREVLARFRQQNFHIAVDDVGTGYSNLASLADIEPDYLKFDTVFVRGIDAHPTKQDLLEALLSFARKMNTKVIAEGIERAEELNTLRSLSVPFGQGFLLARPMPIADIARVQSLTV